MDTYTQAITAKRRHRGLEEKRRIVEETLVEGTSVALIARAHGVNANLVFNWRRLYQAGRLGRRGEAKLLPVKITPERSLTTASSGRRGDLIKVIWFDGDSCYSGRVRSRL
jgi:transposase